MKHMPFPHAEGPYPDVNGRDIVLVPARACTGRAGTLGKTFWGRFDLETGRIRFDCEEAPEFWLEVDFSQVPEVWLQPNQPGYEAAKKEFESVSES